MSPDSVRVRVVLAEDHPAVLRRLHAILEVDCDVVAAVNDGKSAVAETLRHSADVLVCDVSLPGLSGFEVAREVCRQSATVRVVLVTNHRDPVYVSEALRAGISGYVLKSMAPRDLPAAVRAAGAGKTFVSSLVRSTPPSKPGSGN